MQLTIVVAAVLILNCCVADVPSIATTAALKTTPKEQSTSTEAPSTHSTTEEPSTPSTPSPCLSTPLPNLSNNNRSLIFLVETTKETNDYLAKLADNLDSILNSTLASHPDWFNNYVVANFIHVDVWKCYNSIRRYLEKCIPIKTGNLPRTGPTSVDSNIFQSDNIDKVADNIRSLAVSTYSSKCIDYDSLRGLVDVVGHDKKVPFERAEIVVITASDIQSNGADVIQLLKLTGNQMPTIHRITIRTKSCSLFTRSRLVDVTRGTHAFIDTTDDLIKVVSSILSTRYAAQDVLADERKPCNSDSDIQIDSSSLEVFISSSAGEVTAVRDPRGVLLNHSMLYQTPVGSRLYSFMPAMAGAYKIMRNDSDVQCDLRVWSTGGANVLFGFAASIDGAAIHDNGSNNRQNWPVFRTYHTLMDNDTEIFDGQASGVKISTSPDYDKDKEKFNSGKIEHGSCVYADAIVDKSFVCDDIEKLLRVDIGAIDSLGVPFTRVAYTWCKNELPPTPAPPPSTLPTGDTTLGSSSSTFSSSSSISTASFSDSSTDSSTTQQPKATTKASAAIHTLPLFIAYLLMSLKY